MTIGYNRAKLLKGAVLNLSYDKVHNIVEKSLSRISELKPDCLIAVMRSGLVPAFMISARLHLPIYFANYNRGENQVGWDHDLDLSGKRVLIVDDFVSTALTLKTMLDFFQDKGAKVFSYALYYDEFSPLKPDLGFQAPHFIKFPWDRLEVTPSSAELFQQVNSRYKPADVCEYYGIDMDGIIVPDLRRKWYKKRDRLQFLLNFRDKLRKMDTHPKTNLFSSVIVTGRPVMDYARTRTWLDQNGFDKLPLVCRDPAQFGDGLEDAARYKASKIHDLGISTYFESDLQQALVIAELSPFVDVIWWGKNRKVRISASQPKDIFD